MAWTLDDQPETDWGLNGPGTTDWGLEAGATEWIYDDELWPPFTDGSFFLDPATGAYVGWVDWAPGAVQPDIPTTPPVVVDPTTYLTDEGGTMLQDSYGRDLLPV